ncbi:PREDICTED: translation initiation factor IF-2-like [Capra hircus]|uniref:translation initiation factor IF-2-like n=1 Tax=Capra hircus TaxID=9925 RepID=UPI000846F3F8|nr:PREDICTED: translation initiation factor IF-2-like [Capra hircus]
MRRNRKAFEARTRRQFSKRPTVEVKQQAHTQRHLAKAAGGLGSFPREKAGRAAQSSGYWQGSGERVRGRTGAGGFPGARLELRADSRNPLRQPGGGGGTVLGTRRRRARQEFPVTALTTGRAPAAKQPVRARRGPTPSRPARPPPPPGTAEAGQRLPTRPPTQRPAVGGPRGEGPRSAGGPRLWPGADGGQTSSRLLTPSAPAPPGGRPGTGGGAVSGGSGRLRAGPARGAGRRARAPGGSGGGARLLRLLRGAAGRWARARRAGVRPGRAPPPELGRAIPMMPSHRARLPERGRRRPAAAGRSGDGAPGPPRPARAPPSRAPPAPAARPPARDPAASPGPTRARAGGRRRAEWAAGAGPEGGRAGRSAAPGRRGRGRRGRRGLGRAPARHRGPRGSSWPGPPSARARVPRSRPGAGPSGGSPRRVVLRERPPAVVGLHLRTLKWLLTSPAMHVLVHQTDGSGKLELLWLTVFGLRELLVCVKSQPTRDVSLSLTPTSRQFHPARSFAPSSRHPLLTTSEGKLRLCSFTGEDGRRDDGRRTLASASTSSAQGAWKHFLMSLLGHPPRTAEEAEARGPTAGRTFARPVAPVRPDPGRPPGVPPRRM